MKHILITGGAGFIGTNLSRKLIDKGYRVTVLDNLSPQIHGENFQYRSLKQVQFIKGDVRNKEDLQNALKDVEAIVHLAAETGTGQSMYEVHRYVDINISGTAIMLDYLVNERHNVQKVVVASSRAIYGEGKYSCDEHGVMYPSGRSEQNLSAGKFDPVCAFCGGNLRPLPTDEESKLHPTSVYGITKLTQEQMVLNVCQSVGVPAVAFRYQNVYGPGQSLKNPYTGILSIFSSLMRSGKNINIFEDGQETRDFVYIDDVVKATILGMESSAHSYEAYNVGSGFATTVLEVAERLKQLYNADIEIKISGNYRIGDIRHNVADLKKIREHLGFEPDYSFHDGVKKFVNWVLEQEIGANRYEESIQEMKSKGLLK